MTEEKIKNIRELPDSDLLNVIDEIKWRDFCMKNLFNEFREAGMKPGKAIRVLMSKYSLGWNTVRNIVYEKKHEAMKKRFGELKATGMLTEGIFDLLSKEYGISTEMIRNIVYNEKNK
jgi:hypothetical protein